MTGMKEEDGKKDESNENNEGEETLSPDEMDSSQVEPTSAGREGKNEKDTKETSSYEENLSAPDVLFPHLNKRSTSKRQGNLTMSRSAPTANATGASVGSSPRPKGFLDSAPFEESNQNFNTDDDFSSINSADMQDLENVGFFRRLISRCDHLIRSVRWTFRNSGGYGKGGRLLDRDNAYHQCTGRLHIHQQANRKTQSEILALYGDDWFHVVLSWPTWQLVLMMATIYTLNLTVFTGFYLAVDDPGEACAIGSDPDKAMEFQTAFGFSLITSSTIGYGFPGSASPFFSECPNLVVVVYFQVIASLLINALVVGMVLQRLGRADSRSHQVVFSDKACIRCINGRFYLMFQVYDLDRRHPVVEAHIRCYAAFHETDGTDTAHFQTRYMRLQNPNDELGGVLFLSVPCTVVHCIDQWSPLMPPEESRKTWVNYNDNFVHNASNRYVFPGLILREADSESGNRDGASCPICGESFPTDQHLLRHIRFSQWEEKLSGGKPVLSNIAGLNLPSLDDDDDVDEVVEHLPDNAREALLAHQVRMGQSPNVRGTENSDIDVRPAKPSNSVGSKGIKISHRTKVNRMLRFYADLSIPLGHQDVDMNLLPTEEKIMPENENRRRPKTDLFSLFEGQKKHSEEVGAEKETNESSTPTPNPAKRSRPFRPKTRPVDDFRETIHRHVESSGIEIVVLVEGIEARSSNTFQARHSYTAEDIEFDKFFAPCMAVSADGNAQVNLNSFHQMVPVPSYASEVIVQSHT